MLSELREREVDGEEDFAKNEALQVEVLRLSEEVNR